MTSELLNDDDYLTIIKTFLKTSTNVKILSAEWSPLPGNIEGLMGDHYILTITHDSDKQNFFVKTQSTRSKTQQEVSSTLNAYEKETFLYDHLFKEFESYNLPNQFCPRSYYCKDAKTIVMEDLRESGYLITKRKNLYGLEDCKRSLTALANFHANGLIYEEIKEKELGRKYRLDDEFAAVFKEVLFAIEDGKGVGFAFMENSKNCLLKLTELLPESEEWKKSFCQRLESFDFISMFYAKIPGRKTCGHGDLWCSNMMFNSTNGTCKLIDFQALRYYHPILDVLLLVYLNTLKEFLNQHLEGLLEFYYETFSKFLNDSGLEPGQFLAKNDYYESYKMLRGLAAFLAASVRTLIFFPVEFTPENVAGMDWQEIWFKDRAKYVLEGCKKDEAYKRILLGDIYDLNKVL